MTRPNLSCAAHQLAKCKDNPYESNGRPLGRRYRESLTKGNLKHPSLYAPLRFGVMMGEVALSRLTTTTFSELEYVYDR